MEEFENFDQDIILTQNRFYTDDYKEECFQVWYNSGKIPAYELQKRIPHPTTNMGNKPTKRTLQIWVNEWSGRAKELDEGVRETMDDAIIAAKVDMLKKHVQTGITMQNIALDFLEEHKAEMTAASAVRLLVEGLRVERESMGIPGMLEKMSEMSDEQLLEEVTKVFENSDVRMLDDENE